MVTSKWHKIIIQTWLYTIKKKKKKLGIANSLKTITIVDKVIINRYYYFYAFKQYCIRIN